jgi:hypothetical protein
MAALPRSEPLPVGAYKAADPIALLKKAKTRVVVPIREPQSPQPELPVNGDPNERISTNTSGSDKIHNPSELQQLISERPKPEQTIPQRPMTFYTFAL